MNRARLSRVACLAALIGAVTSGQSEPDGQYRRETAVVRVYRKTHEAVVNVSGERRLAGRGGRDYDWPPLFDLWGPRFQQQVPVLGSGFVVHEDAFIVTNAHVVEAVERVKVVFSDGREFKADVVSMDPSKDLAVLSVQTEAKLPAIDLGRSDDLMIGETVVAIGNPYGYANTVTSGVISAVGRDIQVTEGFWLRGLIQTDAPINPGNSGGPLLNVNARLIGVTTAIRAEAQNIGFAIPVDTLVDNLSDMLMPETLRRVRLGLTMGRLTVADGFTGVVIDAVGKGSPADEKGLAPGDLVLSVDERKLSSVFDFYVWLMRKQVGDPIQLTYWRPGQATARPQGVKLTLLPRPLPDGRLLARRYFQMEVSELTAAVARRFNFESAYPILIVTDVDPKGQAAAAGIRSGDLILQLGRTTVRDLREFSLEMEKTTAGDILEVKLLRIELGLFGQIERRLVTRLRAKTRNSSSPGRS